MKPMTLVFAFLVCFVANIPRAETCACIHPNCGMTLYMDQDSCVNNWACGGGYCDGGFR